MSDKQLRAKVTIDSDPSGLRKLEVAASGVSKSVKEIEKESRDANRVLGETRDTTTELEGSLRDLREELSRAERSFESSKSVAIAMKTEYLNLRDSGVGTREAFRGLSKQIEEAEVKELDAITATRKLIAEITEMGDESVASAAELADLSKRLQESEGYITGVGGKAALQAQKMDELRTSTDRAGDELQQLGNKADEANTSLKRVGDGLDNAGQSLGNIESKVGTVAYAMGNILGNALQEAAQATFQFASQSYEDFRNFDDEANRAFAQIPGMSAEMRDSLTGDAKVIASQIGRLPEEVLPALRKAMNLGISEDNLLGSIQTASMAARISGESLIDTMVLGQSVVNAYGNGLYDLSTGYDYLNYITQSSNLEFGDLNANMNVIISAAAEAGVGLDSVAGAMITMNRQGDDAAEIGQLLSNVLTQISIEGTALGSAFETAAGVGFREFTASGGTLVEGLQILDAHAKATGQDLLNMVGGSSPFFRDVQAARGILELTGRHAADLAANIDGATQSTGGLAAAAQEFEDGPALAYDKAAVGVANLKLALGETIAVAAQDSGLLANATIFLELFNGTLTEQISQQTDALAAQAAATGDYATALAQLNATYEGAGISNKALVGPIEETTMTLVNNMAKASKSYEDFEAQVIASNAEVVQNGEYTFATLAGQSFQLKPLYDEQQIQATIDYYEALSQVDYWQTAVASSGVAGADANLLASYKKGAQDAAAEVGELHEVLKVLDGDTIDIELEGEVKSVRFRNINAPEIQHEDAAAMPWAYEAMRKTQEYFDKNPLNLQGQMSRESYDRIIAAVPDLERDLVASGLALPLPVSLTEDPEAFEEFKELTQRAAAAGVGMFEDQALAARVLNGEMVDLGKYYEEMAAHQATLTGYFSEATGPVTTLFTAYQSQADAPAWGIDEAKDAVVEGNAAIVASYQQTAYEIYLAQNGVTEGTISMGVAMGIFTEQEGLARLEFANTQTAIEELIIQQDELHLSDQELIEATQLLINGMAATPEQAANAAKGLERLGSAAGSTRDQVRETRQALLDAQGDYSATFTVTNKTYNKTYNETYNTTTNRSEDKVGGEQMASGGRLQANTPYIVGDAPGGRLTPYSELFVPDQSGYLLNARTTASLLGGGEGSTTSTAAPGRGGDTYIFQITIEGGQSDLVEAAKSGVLQAASQIGMKL